MQPNLGTPPASAAPALFGVGTKQEGRALEGALNLDLFQASPALNVLGGAPRIGANTTENLQAGVEPLLALSVLELGTPQHATFPGSIIFPDVTKPKWRMGYWTWTGNEQLKLSPEGLVRAFRTARERAEFKGARVETDMTRRGIVTPLDIDEIRISEELIQLEAHGIALARDLVNLAVEYQKQQLGGVAASYPASHAVDATGSEWDAAGGDSRADIQAMVDQLVGANPPYQKESIHVVITYGARDAALRDPTWAALPNSPQSFGRTPTMEDLRAYWDVGRVTVADVVYDPGTGTPVSMWGDVAVGFIDPRLQGGIVSEWGRATFGVNFKFVGSVISAPWYDNELTSWMYPFDSYDHPAMIQGKAGYLITDVKE